MFLISLKTRKYTNFRSENRQSQNICSASGVVKNKMLHISQSQMLHIPKVGVKTNMAQYLTLNKF